MRKREIFMLSALTFTAGIVVGFLLSPVKHGIVNIAGNTTGSTTKNSYDKKQEIECEAEDVTNI